MMAANELKADPGAIRDHLRHMTRRWGELGQDCVFEVRFLTSDNEAEVRNVARFPADEAGIEYACEHITEMNRHRLNAYAVVNPIDAHARIPAGKAASDDTIIASCFHWADADDAEAAENIRSFVGPRPTYYVLTGTQPCLRPHVYWELEEPTRNLEAWTATQRAIAATLKSDRTVVNPSRIMRIAGTVNWPKPKKQAKGYTQEITTLRIYSPDERPRVSSERMARAFTGSPDAGGNGFTIDTGHAGKSAEDYADILRRARTDGEKHSGVRDLAASLAGSGVPRALAEAIIRDACPVWDAGVIKLIDTAYQKFFPNGSERTPNFDYAPSDDAESPATWTLQSAAAFTADFIAPEYIVDGVIQRGRLYTLTAPTGSGKTAVMLYAAVSIAQGEMFYDRDVECGDVLFMAGENPDDVRARVIGTMEYYGIDPTRCRVHFIPGTFSIRSDMERLKAEAAKLPNLVLIVIDTFAAYFDGDDENSNAQALDFARVARRLTALPSKPAVVMPAHPVKNATRSNLSPKGGSSLVNEVDGNLTLWNEGGIVTLHWQVKFRGPEFQPLSFELHRYESELIKDAKGRLMPTILAKPLLTVRASEISRENMTLEDRLLLSIRDDQSMSLSARAEAIGTYAMKVKRLIQKLQSQKLIRPFRTNWELTKEGERAVEMILNGESFAPEIDP
jgi:hypothetical protein